MSFFTLDRLRHRVTDRDITLLAHRDFLAPVPDSVLLNLANVPEDSHTKPRSTLFGPLLEQPRGNASGQNKKPLPVEKKVIAPVVVQNWVDRSQDSNQATTTLHALVNLKTSSLRLFPLSVSKEDALDGSSEAQSAESIVPHDAPHCLEFQYDCDAPKVRISLDVYSKKRPDGKSSKTTVYSAVFDGGFGRSLKVEDGATLELSHILASLQAEGQVSRAQQAAAPSSTAVNASADGEAGLDAAAPAASNDAGVNSARRRLSAFAFKRRHQRSDLAGPALRVVDVDAVTEPTTLDSKKNDVNVRVSITLEALDEQERSLKSVNLQSTRLVIVRAGQAASETEADTRHWTVQVVRRDATIGSHTFRLQDIYGLSSNSKSPAALPPSNPTPTTYPPAPPITVAPAANDTDDVSSECVLCLSSPREVVLLPCRHLVACKDCALNMVEYGAGGQLVQPTEDAAPTGTGAGETGDGEAEGTGADGEAADTPAVAPAPAAVPRPSRRRRRAKGWHCPVCRQPYTSMLRISTAVPGKESSADLTMPTVPAPVATTNAKPTGFTNMLSNARPGFLRGLSRGASPTTPTGPTTTGVVTSGVDHPLQMTSPAPAISDAPATPTPPTLTAPALSAPVDHEVEEEAVSVRPPSPVPTSAPAA